MNVKDYLKSFVLELQPVLENFFRQKAKEARSISPLTTDLISRLEDLNAGGKKIRGALLKLGYQSFGGKDAPKILPACAAIEILNTALLIHDDIIDRADLRRGKITIHRRYEKLHGKNNYPNSASHYGQSIAIIAGDIGIVSCFELISGLKLPQELVIKALRLMARIITEVGYGEVLDVDISCRDKTTKEEIFQINNLKTSRYTTSGPFQLGAILAGANNSYLNILQKYAEPLGLAFQLKDDILSMFGSEEEIGKSILSDLKEGKKTLLYLRTRQEANSIQRKMLEKSYGNLNATEDDLKEIRGVMIETGAREECERLCSGLIQDAKKYIPQITSNDKLQEVLVTLADFVIERKS